MIAVKSKKWYGHFWPPERRKARVLQALVNYWEPEVTKKVEKAWQDHLLYGKPLPVEEPNAAPKEQQEEDV